MPIEPSIMITPDRVLHICRLGSRLDRRLIGALVIYVGLEGDIRLHAQGEDPLRARVVAVPAFTSHRITAGYQYVKTILIEPETVTQECLTELRISLNGLGFAAAKSLGLFDPDRHPDQLLKHMRPDYSAHAFDDVVFNTVFPSRTLDDRIITAAGLVKENISDVILTSDCMGGLSISSSRFRRLFVQDTGIQFRHYKMWRRARSYLEQIKTPASLTQIALNLGYPDSTHFSRSIRATYGLPPRAMKTSMQDASFFLAKGNPGAGETDRHTA